MSDIHKIEMVFSLYKFPLLLIGLILLNIENVLDIQNSVTAYLMMLGAITIVGVCYANKNLISSNLLVKLGNISYEFYLIHFIVLLSLKPYFTNPYSYILICFIVSLGLSGGIKYVCNGILKFGGISRGLAEIISHFPSDIAYDIAIKESDNVYLKEYNLDNNHSPISYQFSDFLPNVSFKGKRRIYNILSQRGWINSSDSINLHHSIEKIKKEDYDVFHPTYFSTYFLKHIRKPFVLTVHDLTAENFPLYFNKFDYQKEGNVWFL